MSDTIAIKPLDTAQPNPDADIAVGASSVLPDPRNFLAIFARRFWIFFVIFVAVLGSAIAYAVFAPRIYSATATVLIEPQRADPVQPREFAPADAAPTSDFIDTQILILDSPQIAQQVVRELRLADDAQFSPAIVADAQQLSPAQLRNREIATAERLRANVTIRRAGQTSLIEVLAQSRSPVQSARIANEYIEQYLLSVDAAKAATTLQADSKIDSRLEELRRNAEAADGALQRYKIANGLMSAEGATLAEQETSTLNQQIAQARATLAERQGRLAAARRQLQKGGGGGDVTSALNSGTIGTLRVQEAESSRTLAQLRTRYGAKHPSIAQEEQRLNDVQRQIQLEIDRVLTSLEGEVNVAASGVSSLEASQARSSSRLASNTTAQVGFLELERKAAAARTIYEAFLNRSRGAAARDGIEAPIATLSSAAIVPIAPTSPNVPLIGLLGLVFGLTGGIVGVAAAEFLDSRIRTKADVERRLGARYLGVIPDIESTLDGIRMTEPPEEYIISHPLSNFAEAMRSLRTSITLRGNRRPRVIAVTSALPREGKTTTAICLARSIALSGTSTVLVDMDLRRHSASDILLNDRPGNLLRVLQGNMTVSEALVPDMPTGLQLLCVSPSDVDEVHGALTETNLAGLLAELRTQFDHVIIDTAPVLGIADTRSVASQADAVILLARWRHTSIRAADSALDLLIGVQAKVYGVALTIVDIRKFGSTGSEDVYGYHKKFKGYYVN